MSPDGMRAGARFAFRGSDILLRQPDGAAAAERSGAAGSSGAGTGASPMGRVDCAGPGHAIPGSAASPAQAARQPGALIPGLASGADLDSAAAELAAPGASGARGAGSEPERRTWLERLAVPGGGQTAELYAPDVEAPAGWAWIPFRSVVTSIEEPEWRTAAKAMALVHWKASTRFCGRCGSPNGDKPDELARLCPSCGALSFPRISPAVLAAVTKDGKLLLARNVMHKTGIWSLLAGFVEPGETIEGCARREVFEEVGVEVEANGYLGSQPWPFPDQLMFGVSAEWKTGELRPDGVEIAEAGWFGPGDALPPLPMRGSLSRRIIDLMFERLSAEGIRGRSS